MTQFILASASPRRQSLLAEAGYEFRTHPAGIDEEAVAQRRLLPAELAVELADAKARDVARQFPADLILAADTVVAFGDQVLGKPADLADARRILDLLSGTTHIVITGLALLHLERNWSRTARVMSAVHMRPLGAREIEDYLATGQWQGKAGAYGIQDPDPFVTRMTGSHSNIVGLPMKRTAQLLAEAGISPVRPSQRPMD